MADPSPHPSFSERRKHARRDLRVLAHIFRGSDVIRITTQNISIGGFYGLCDEPFVCGEQYDSVLEINALLRSSHSGAHLQCVVRVIRVETMNPDPAGIDPGGGQVDDGRKHFGVAFSVESYRVNTSQT